ncbi:MAG: HlyD family secretion protein [Chloroflexota bacterium]
MKLKLIVLIILFTIFVLTACNAATTSTATPTALPPVSAEIAVVATGHVVPGQYANIGFGQAGKIAEVLLAAGDRVEAGQIIARLESTEAAQAETARAELEVLLAQQALDDLYDHSDADQAALQLAIANAYLAVQDAQNRIDRLAVPAEQAALSPLEAAAQARQDLDEARAAYEPYENKDETEASRERKRKLDRARMDFNTAVQRAGAEADLATAQATLDEAIADYETAGQDPDADLVTAAAARLSAAKAALAAVQDAGEQLVLRAPFAGVVTAIDLKVGEFAGAGQPSVTVADLRVWVVETEDLTELDVVKLQNGQGVHVTLDALPDARLDGTISAIADAYGQRQGDITYRVTIRLNDAPDGLRWGMTAQARFIPPAAASAK